VALYKNNTGQQSKIGYVVKVDSRSPKSFVYAGEGETNILGIITQAVPNGAQCNIATSDTTKVFISERTVQGSVIRAKTSTDNISRGTCKTVKSTDTTYFKIGTALETGRGLINCSLNLSYVSPGGGGVYNVFTAAVDGLVPNPVAATNKYLKDNATWDDPLLNGNLDGGEADTVYGGLDPVEGGSA
jgi:hypothetical protein